MLVNINRQASYRYIYEPELTRHYTNTPTNQPCNKTLCQSAYGTDPMLALYCHILSTNNSAAMSAITINDHTCMPTIYEPDNRRTDMPVI
jgi:hypothetical protein